MLFPLLIHRRTLRDAGVSLHYFAQLQRQLTDCDVLVLDCKSFGRRWVTEPGRVSDEIATLAERTRVVYFDITDSTALEHPAALRVVHAYWKSQVLGDLAGYGVRHYGSRLFTDYYHHNFGVIDDPENWSEPVTDPRLLAKIRLAWNVALSDYSFGGLYRLEAYRMLPLPSLLRLPQSFVSPEAPRTTAVSARMTLNYGRASVAFQRQRIQMHLRSWLAKGRLSRRAFFRELEQSKLVVSPFGWGEIAYRDFEAILSGAMLLKPDMRHMDTWPNLYSDGQTIITFPWSLEGLDELIQESLANDGKRIEIAHRAQETYRHYLSGPAAAEIFTNRFVMLLRAAQSAEL